MKKLGHYFPVLLGIAMVLGALFLTGGFFAAPPAVFQETTQAPSEIDVTTLAEPSATGRTYKKVPSVVGTYTGTMPATTSSKETTTTSSTTTTTKTTVTQLPYQPYQGGRFNKLIIFLDIQRVVFYTTDPETGADVPAYAVKCSTGKAGYATPTTPVNSPIRLPRGGRAVLSKFTSLKSPIPCWVRYSTRITGSIYFHSIPSDYVEGVSTDKIDFSKVYMKGGYTGVYGGYPTSHGCIRLAVRDAKFVQDHTYPGMLVYIFSSSAGYSLAPPQPLPVPPHPKWWRDWDPTDWNSPKYKPMPTETTTTTTTSATEPSTSTGTVAPTTVTTPSVDPTAPTTPMSNTNTTAPTTPAETVTITTTTTAISTDPPSSEDPPSAP